MKRRKDKIKRTTPVPNVFALDYGVLPNLFTEENTLVAAFENLNLQAETSKMAEIQELREQMAGLMGECSQRMATLVAENNRQMAMLITANQELVQKMTVLENNQAAVQNANAVAVTEYVDINPTYTSGDTIQLDAFKVIPEFNGEKKIYRSWRSQVSKLMKQIEEFKTHPKYAAALSIIRAKITGAASDILINNNTAHNVDAIIDRLDFSYADQRPLYVIEAEMTMVKQNGKSLQEYYDTINQALNMVLTKITMTYKEAAEQKSLMIESQSKAIRTFITGLQSPLIRTTLYGNMPKTLAQAFAVAQTIQYDNQHLQLDQQLRLQEQQRSMKKSTGDMKPKYNPNFHYQPQQQSTQAPNPNGNTAPHQKQQSKPTPMDVDSSKRYIQSTQFQRPTQFQSNKRDRDPSFQNANKQQRVNNIDGVDDIQSIYQHESLENNCNGTDDDECHSTISTQESIFLEE